MPGRRHRRETRLRALIAGIYCCASLSCESKTAPDAPGPAQPLPSCAFREPRCIPKPLREPQPPAHVISDGPPMPFRPGEVLEDCGLYVGLHRYAVTTPCRLQLAWNLCRDYSLGDVEYDEQLYISKIRIHRDGRGGRPFAARAAYRHTLTASLGMSKREFLRKNPNPKDVSNRMDPEFGAIEVYRYDLVEYEFDVVDADRILGAITLI